MRDLNGWTKRLESMFLPADRVHDLTLLAKVELGLRLVEELDRTQPPTAVWTLLGGYHFARVGGLVDNPAAEWMVTCARHRLWTLRRRRNWMHALQRYVDLPDHLRRYGLDPALTSFTPLKPSHAADRDKLYEEELRTLPPHARQSITLAKPGRYRLIAQRRITTLTIPDECGVRDDDRVRHGAAHRLANVADPLDIPLCELGDVADHIDGLGIPDEDNWRERFDNLYLYLRGAGESEFKQSGTLRLERLLHLVGMVGAGKSTLMVLLAVWAAQNGLRITLVVGDVAEQLRLTRLLRHILDDPEDGDDTAVAPVLGTATRQLHVERLHRRVAARGRPSILQHSDEDGFDSLSTACPADPLRDVPSTAPLRFTDAPCTGLYDPSPEATDDEEPDRGALDGLGPARGCPLWYRCPRHLEARHLVTAKIWVANPASLLQSRVPRHLSVDRMRYLELACARSDIVVVDEADRVMANLDIAFAPSATLVVKGPDSWLDRVLTHKIGELAREGRVQLTDPVVARWEMALTVVGTATNRLYEMLIKDENLREWVGIEYFSSWTLQEKLLHDWYPEQAPGSDPPAAPVEDWDRYESDADAVSDSGAGPAPTPWAARKKYVAEAFDDFRDDPLGDRGIRSEQITDALTDATKDLLQTVDSVGARQRTRTALELLLEGPPALGERLPTPEAREGADIHAAEVPGSPEWYERMVVRLEFALLVAALHHRLDQLTQLWPQVESALRLDRTDNELVRRPLHDYAPIIPESPMGNVLGFQYLPDQEEDHQGRVTGTLRFFRCEGVGRELLLSLPEIGRDHHNGRHGPHVMLMSGTSWAGTSTKSHVIAPVRAVLGPKEEFLDAVKETVFTTRFLYDGNRPLSLSGAPPGTKADILRKMVHQLARPVDGRKFSPLDEELAAVADSDRRRVLLLVGSYKDALEVANLLDAAGNRWNGRVRALVPDDQELAAQPTSSATGVRRGDVADFAKDEDAEVLVAPLMAVERGHNILNVGKVAAFGVAIFLARPHPRPDDLAMAVFAINDWATRYTRGLGRADTEYGTFEDVVTKHDDLDLAGKAFRKLGRTQWNRVLHRRYVYTRLGKHDKQSFAWDHLVTMWQVIGRLVRGGVPARVVFVDAKFAPRAAAAAAPNADPKVRGQRDTAASSLLVNLREVLAPYFDPDSAGRPSGDPADSDLVQRLYQPLYNALCEMPEVGPPKRPTRS
ncbi:hypothetical protein [Saccharothrix australiensis]|uniref:pPIWI-RE three-gene island domain-containing protein n=1 Tax=Saccharothrix australiensis TaxID=2072 RepID=A0A495W7P2_9PSEU|nr:hypothetical protein [Saccharothrix australiensis]RKT56653.1 hypothetical protein C8E97_5362 [Saccharothrix australiensis]